MRPMKYILAIAAWLVVIAIGGWWQLSYERTPGLASANPPRYPDSGPIAARPGHPLAIMALHPRCPCSRASLAELEQLASANPDLDLVVLACVPIDANDDWMSTDNCSKARAIPGVRLIPDPSGRTAAELGMKTSGHVIAYDADRRLVFSGGITAARGQTGPNPGLDALIAAFQKSQPGDSKPSRAASAAPALTPVFGCTLVAPEACEAPRGENTP